MRGLALALALLAAPAMAQDPGPRLSPADEALLDEIRRLPTELAFALLRSRMALAASQIAAAEAWPECRGADRDAAAWLATRLARRIALTPDDIRQDTERALAEQRALVRRADRSDRACNALAAITQQGIQMEVGAMIRAGELR